MFADGEGSLTFFDPTDSFRFFLIVSLTVLNLQRWDLNSDELFGAALKRRGANFDDGLPAGVAQGHARRVGHLSQLWPAA